MTEPEALMCDFCGKEIVNEKYYEVALDNEEFERVHLPCFQLMRTWMLIGNIDQTKITLKSINGNGEVFTKCKVLPNDSEGTKNRIKKYNSDGDKVFNNPNNIWIELYIICFTFLVGILFKK